jgi:hypothetical protein
MTAIWVVPTTWDGTRKVDCLILVEVDGRLNHEMADFPDRYDIGSGAKSVSISATSLSHEWWSATVTFEPQPDGTLKQTSLSGAAAVETPVLSKGSVTIPKVVIRLLRVRDATADFVEAFDTSVNTALQPAEIPPDAGKAVQGLLGAMNFTDAFIRQRVDDDRSPVLIPERALSLLPDRPVVLDLAKADAGKLALKVTAPFAPKNDTFVVEIGGMSQTAPRTIAVSWPQDLPPDQPAPMFVFFRHAPQQESYPYIGKFLRDDIRGYPFSFDYACYGLLENLWYDFPVHLVPRSRGLPYQVQAAGKKVVTVIACPTATVPTGSSQFGRWVEADFMQEMLLQIQALYAASKGKTGAKQLGRVAIGAFSSGCYYLGQLLYNNGNTAHPFLTGTVKECYVFSSDNHVLQTSCLPHVVAWQKAVTSGDGIIRLYNSLVMDEQKQLVKSAGSTTPFFTDSADGRTTVSAITERDWSRAITAAAAVPTLKRSWDGMQAHFATSALLVTHAMHKSGFS